MPLAKTKRTNLMYSPVPFRSSSAARIPADRTKISVHRLFYAQFYDSRLPVIKRARRVRRYTRLKMPFIIYHTGRARRVRVSIRAAAIADLIPRPRLIRGDLTYINFHRKLLFARDTSVHLVARATTCFFHREMFSSPTFPARATFRDTSRRNVYSSCLRKIRRNALVHLVSRHSIDRVVRRLKIVRGFARAARRNDLRG